MNYLDIYYRALIDYRKNTADFRDCVNQRLSTAKANANDDNLTITRKICSVDSDWVEAIEEGLVHVEKAIREERQFIRSNGEVIDIEKVKNVSKDSVEHLARHSNLITRYEEGKDVVPDRLYTVERLSDYAVYENRFLYMLLCYLRDFITVRYNKILELEHTYNGSMSMNKTIVMTKRSLAFEIKMQEERKDDLYLKKQSESRDIIVRIGNQLKLVLAFLSTPLMQEVAKSPMLKPPVTKTNVLRMNHNFRGALALYEFISAYDKPGYTAEEKVNTQNPFRTDVADEMAEIVMIASFLTYEHGLGLKGELQMEFDKEEERRREEEKKKLLEQLKALRHRIRESGSDPEEYMLMLEKANRLLQEDRERLFTAKQEIEQLKEEIAVLEREKKSLNGEITRLGGNIEEMKKTHAAEIEKINTENSGERSRLVGEYDEKLLAQKSLYDTKIAAMNTEAQNKEQGFIEKLKSFEQSKAAEMSAQAQKHNEELLKKDELYKSLEDANKELSGKFDSLTERHRIVSARLTAMRQEKGMKHDTEDYTSEEAFGELERQLETFAAFFNKQWGITKKTIRKKAFKELKKAIKEDKLKKGQDKDTAMANNGQSNEASSVNQVNDIAFNNEEAEANQNLSGADTEIIKENEVIQAVNENEVVSENEVIQAADTNEIFGEETLNTTLENNQEQDEE